MIYTAKHNDYQPQIVVFSVAMAFLGAYMTINISDHLRLSLIEEKRIFGPNVSVSHKKKHLLYLFLMSLSLAGVGIWAMHFIGMNSCHINYPNGERVRIEYNIPLVIASFLCAWFLAFVGLMIASYDPMFSKNKFEIVEEFIADTKRLSIKEIRKISTRKMLAIIATKDLGRLVTGGLCLGAGVSIMHYVGMEASIFDGDIHYYPGLVCLSVLTALVASCLAFWILFRLLSIFPDQEGLRLGSALAMAIAVCGMHYTGMEATMYKISDGGEKHTDNLSSAKVHMSYRVSYAFAAIAANVLLWVLVVFSTWHARSVNSKHMKIIRQADLVIQKLATESAYLLSSNNQGQSDKTPSVSLSPSMVRSLAEQYLTKRIRNFERRLEMTSETRDLLAEVNHQMQMGFVEFLLHVTLLFLTGQLKKATILFRTEGGSSMDGGSTQGSDHGSLTALESGAAIADPAVAGEEKDDDGPGGGGLLSFRRALEQTNGASMHSSTHSRSGHSRRADSLGAVVSGRKGIVAVSEHGDEDGQLEMTALAIDPPASSMVTISESTITPPIGYAGEPLTSNGAENLALFQAASASSSIDNGTETAPLALDVDVV